jgi:hypothetical protein
MTVPQVVQALRKNTVILLFSLAVAAPVSAQFLDTFDGKLSLDAGGVKGWTFFTGDGAAVMDFRNTGGGHAAISVDATKDTRGIWWALIRRRVSANMNLRLLGSPAYALRIESRIRVSHAPRRVNLHLNSQRTTDFHSHLVEFDIPDTLRWHTISMTTRGFDALPGDTVYGQLALMDWGPEKYHVELKYFRVDIVKVDSAGPDKGTLVPYHPPIPNPLSFPLHLPATQDCVVDTQYPLMNFNDWSAQDGSGRSTLLAVSGTQYTIMRWDLGVFAGKRAEGSGLLELTAFSVERSLDHAKDFGMVRVTEILGGDPQWDQNDVTYASLCQARNPHEVFNSQMIIDIAVPGERGAPLLATISQPVVQRLLDGRTLGLAIRPLGAVFVSFYALESPGPHRSPTLHVHLGPSSIGPPH